MRNAKVVFLSTVLVLIGSAGFDVIAQGRGHGNGHHKKNQGLKHQKNRDKDEYH